MRDPGLSGLAKAIYIYIMGCAPDWDINYKDLKRHFNDSMHAIRKACTELNEKGLLKFANKKDRYNKFIGKIWQLFGPQSMANTEPRPCVVSRDHGSPKHGQTAQIYKTIPPKDHLPKTQQSDDDNFLEKAKASLRETEKPLPESYDALIAFGVNKTTAKELAFAFEPGHIMQQIEWMAHRTVKSNPAGYLIKCIKTQAPAPQAVQEAAKAAEKAAQLQEEQETIKPILERAKAATHAIINGEQFKIASICETGQIIRFFMGAIVQQVGAARAKVWAFV